MYEIKTEDVYEDFSKDKAMLDFSNNSAKSRYYDNPHKLENGQINNETACVAIEEFVGLKPNMCSFLVDDSSNHKNANGMNKNVVAA